MSLIVCDTLESTAVLSVPPGYTTVYVSAVIIQPELHFDWSTGCFVSKISLEIEGETVVRPVQRFQEITNINGVTEAEFYLSNINMPIMDYSKLVVNVSDSSDEISWNIISWLDFQVKNV